MRHAFRLVVKMKKIAGKQPLYIDRPQGAKSKIFFFTARRTGLGLACVSRPRTLRSSLTSQTTPQFEVKLRSMAEP